MIEDMRKIGLYPTTGETVDPWVLLAAAILNRAQISACGGDLNALAWLVERGAELAERLVPDCGRAVTLELCHEILERVRDGDVVGEWEHVSGWEKLIRTAKI